MAKKQLMLLFVALALFGLSIYFFANWLAPAGIQVNHMVRPYSRAVRFRGNVPILNPTVNTVVFGLDKKYRLTEIKVFNADELATNKYAHPLWHLVSKSSSLPVKGFFYGSYIRGMHHKVPNSLPEPLELNVNYRLIVHAGKLKAEHDFKTTARIVRR